MSQDKNDADRWRLQLEDAEKELESVSNNLKSAVNLIGTSFSEVVSAIGGAEKKFEAHLDNIDNAIRKRIDLPALEVAVKSLLSELAGKKPAAPAAVGESQDVGNEKNQICALLISEILYQLLQNVSLPAELNDKIELLKKCLEDGVSSGSWGDMLELVADTANDIRIKINNERMDTETFLKQVTGRLQELDQFIQGNEESRIASLQRGSVLGDAVKQEMQGLHDSIAASEEISALKKTIKTRLEAIENHFSSYRHDENSRHEKDNQLVKSLVSRLNELEQETVRLRDKVKEERIQAQMDALTGVPNRLGYMEHINQEYARWKRFDHPLSIVVCDVDHFKRINDNYGHAAGDKALKNIAKTLASRIRETDYIARFGGEEFVLIMPGADSEAAKGVSEKLRSSVEALGFHFKGEPVSITISCGIAEFKDDDSVDVVFERADKALYAAKEGGRNQVVVAK